MVKPIPQKVERWLTVKPIPPKPTVIDVPKTAAAEPVSAKPDTEVIPLPPRPTKPVAPARLAERLDGTGVPLLEQVHPVPSAGPTPDGGPALQADISPIQPVPQLMGTMPHPPTHPTEPPARWYGYGVARRQTENPQPPPDAASVRASVEATQAQMMAAAPGHTLAPSSSGWFTPLKRFLPW